MNDSALDMASVFFGYPAGSSWRTINKDRKERPFDFVVANPLYAEEFKGNTYVFTHGTHFRADVTLPVWKKKLADYLELDEVLGNIELESECDVTKAKDLSQLEQIIYQQGE